MRQTGIDIYKFGEPTSSDGKYIYFNSGGDLSGFRFIPATGYIEYSDDGVNWYRLQRTEAITFVSELSIDESDEIKLQGFIDLSAESISDCVSSATYAFALDNGNFVFSSYTNLSGLQAQINAQVTGNRTTGTKFIISCKPVFKSGRENEVAFVKLYATETLS